MWAVTDRIFSIVSLLCEGRTGDPILGAERDAAPADKRKKTFRKVTQLGTCTKLLVCALLVMLLAFALAGAAAGAQNIPRWLHRVAAAVSSAQRLAQLPHCHRPGTLGSGGSDTQAVPQNPKKTDCKDTFGKRNQQSTGLKAMSM